MCLEHDILPKIWYMYACSCIREKVQNRTSLLFYGHVTYIKVVVHVQDNEFLWCIKITYTFTSAHESWTVRLLLGRLKQSRSAKGQSEYLLSPDTCRMGQKTNLTLRRVQAAWVLPSHRGTTLIQKNIMQHKICQTHTSKPGIVHERVLKTYHTDIRYTLLCR